MADNVTANAGSGGAVFATDDISSVHYPINKLAAGALNTATLLLAGGGAEANALLVTIANDSTGLVSVDDGGGALTVDWAGTAPPIGAGVEATALRVTLATDSTGQVTIDGTVTANLSATDNAVLDTFDAVLDLINAKLVTGTVIGDVNLGATDNAVLDDIAAQVTTVAAAVSTEMQVDIVGALPAGTAAIGKLAANSGVDIGDVDVLSIAAGSNLVGDVGLSGARTSGGTTMLKNLDVDEGAGDVIKNTAGQLYWIHAMNTGAVPNYLKFYNVAGASVTVGTTVPDLTFLVPANADSDGAGFFMSLPNGVEFDSAMSMAATLLAADNDSTAPTGTVVVNLGYA